MTNTPFDCSTDPIPVAGQKPRRFATSLDSEENRLLIYLAFLEKRAKADMARKILIDYLQANREEIEVRLEREARRVGCKLEQLKWYALGIAKQTSRSQQKKGR